MSTYPLATTVACEDMRYPISRCGDCPYHFYHPFYEENIFKDSGPDIVIKTIDGKIQQSSKSRLQKCSNKLSSPQKHNVPKNRKENILTDSGSDLEINTKNSKIQQSSKSRLQQCSNKLLSPNQENVPNNRTYTVSTICLERPIRVPSLTKGEKRLETCTSHHNNYHRLRVIHSFMDKLESDYPSICSTGSIGRSLEGRDLKILRISNSNAKNIAVWIDAGIHAREWIAPATAIYLADNIAKNFSTLPGFITNKDWYFLPVMNPDGYEYSHTRDRMWRKNKAWHKGQFVGVDLNRNFSYGWGGLGSSDEPTNVFYHGPFAFSEPESTAVRDMLLNSGTKFTVYLTLHSYGQVILFPFACKDELCPSYVRLLEGATIMSRAIYNCNGNTYKVGISRDVMYGAAGTSNDWSYGVAGIPYCYLLELRSKKHRFKVPSEEIEETGKEILSSVIALMEFVDNYTPLKVGALSVHETEEEDRNSIRSISTRGSRSTTKSTRSARSTK